MAAFLARHDLDATTAALIVLALALLVGQPLAWAWVVS